MNNVLITGGCSFSEVRNNPTETWPVHLANILKDYDSVHTGMSSQGNGIISRKVIYEVQKAIQNGLEPRNILVGIMWSSPNRFDIFSDSTPPGYTDKDNKELGIYENPTRFVEENLDKQWYIFNHNWQKTYFNQTYYKLYHNETMHMILTIEHILRVQWFLKSLGVRYFMTCYTSKVFLDESIAHPEVKYLYDLVDFKNFLPVKGEYEWCRDSSKFEFPDPTDLHPGSNQHKDFTETVIYPWMLSNDML